MQQRILVVEDEPDYRDLIAAALCAHGYAVDSAGTGAEAFEAYRAGEPDLVVLDVLLPDGNGVDLCRRIRAEGPRPTTPVVLCTASSGLGPVRAGLEAGATDYVLKPFKIADLCERVAAALRAPRKP